MNFNCKIFLFSKLNLFLIIELFDITSKKSHKNDYFLENITSYFGQ